MHATLPIASSICHLPLGSLVSGAHQSGGGAAGDVFQVAAPFLHIAAKPLHGLAACQHTERYQAKHHSFHRMFLVSCFCVAGYMARTPQGFKPETSF
jgi:hypothetical protein